MTYIKLIGKGESEEHTVQPRSSIPEPGEEVTMTGH